MRFKKTEKPSAGAGFACKKKFLLFNIVTGISISEKLRIGLVFLRDFSIINFNIYQSFTWLISSVVKSNQTRKCGYGPTNKLMTGTQSIAGNANSCRQNPALLMMMALGSFINFASKKRSGGYPAFYFISFAVMNKMN